MPLGGQLYQPRRDSLALPLQHLRQSHGGKPLIDSRISRQQPVVQQRKRKLHIVRVESLRLASLASLRRKPYPGIPKLLADPPDRQLHVLLGDLPVQQVQQVHIRVGKQLAPAISAERNQRNARPQRRRLLDRPRPQARNQFVHRLRARRDRRCTRRARIERSANRQHPALVFVTHRAFWCLCFRHGCMLCRTYSIQPPPPRANAGAYISPMTSIMQPGQESVSQPATDNQQPL